MIVISMTDCPVGLRGDLTKWLLEINTGVFVGQVSARVRDRLWERITETTKEGRVTMVFNTNNEQRLDFRVHNGTWEPIDFDGIKLMLRPSPSRIKKLGTTSGFQ
jgi:CRISPR-associated protein Cas2